ncbi:hypothetical protein TNIN_198341 [Trichonephila inaurata madagascariensis]|uniref:Uncharacterized protein n=1 Tax=Trichonephila inaurata madagascariensis TaxID=2747483 RepID=A0A8X6YQ08_9ARAC|nr:hypothetical protein TNIN_198341 [Trichonephila inaurata madagascariensis]
MDFLAKRGCSEIATTDYPLPFPDHPDISRKSPGGALESDGDRKDQTIVSRWLSGHLKCMTFESGCKYFQICPKCHLLPASPEHILDCLGVRFGKCLCESTFGARVNGLMDLI